MTNKEMGQKPGREQNHFFSIVKSSIPLYFPRLLAVWGWHSATLLVEDALALAPAGCIGLLSLTSFWSFQRSGPVFLANLP